MALPRAASNISARSPSAAATDGEQATNNAAHVPLSNLLSLLLYQSMSAAEYRTWADAVFLAHAAFVAFVVVGLIVIVVGGVCGWKWIRNPWLRAAHLAAIAVVVLQAWFGMLCPLTTLEMTLREKAGDPTYSGSFIAHWLNKLLYFEAPPWVFAVCYTLFGLTVLSTWFKFRPRSFRRIR